MQNIIMPGMEGSATPVPVVDINAASALTNSAREAMRLDCIRRGLERAKEKGVINQDGSDAIVRQLRATADLNFGANANQNWLTTALVAATRNNIVNSVQVPVNQMVIIYGISTPEASPSLSEFRFQRGTAGAGGLFAIVNMQAIYDKLEHEAYMSKAVLYDPQDIVFIDAMPTKANAAGEVYVLHGYVIESLGISYSALPR